MLRPWSPGPDTGPVYPSNILSVLNQLSVLGWCASMIYRLYFAVYMHEIIYTGAAIGKLYFNYLIES